MNDPPPPDPLRFLASGDRALTVELGDRIDPTISAAVIALDRAIAEAAIAGVGEVVPTYRSLLVFFDPLTLPRHRLIERIAALWPPVGTETAPRRRWRVPVAYGGRHGADIGFVAETHGITEARVAELHTAAAYRVAMIGFAPGYTYLAGLDPALATSRRAEPRRTTPPGTVAIGGAQTAIAPPLALPSGWHLIGRTPVRSFDPARHRPVLFEAGDEIAFEAIDAAEFDALAERAATGDPVAVCEAAG